MVVCCLSLLVLIVCACRSWSDLRTEGDPKDANVYACFAVSESAALRALLGEPRMLGMTPDTVLVDLNAEVGSMPVCAFARVRV